MSLWTRERKKKKDLSDNIFPLPHPHSKFRNLINPLAPHFSILLSRFLFLRLLRSSKLYHLYVSEQLLAHYNDRMSTVVALFVRMFKAALYIVNVPRPVAVSGYESFRLVKAVVSSTCMLCNDTVSTMKHVVSDRCLVGLSVYSILLRGAPGFLPAGNLEQRNELITALQLYIFSRYCT